jgi:hypothetical protein
MLKTYDLLALKKEEGGHYTVGLSHLASREPGSAATALSAGVVPEIAEKEA